MDDFERQLKDSLERARAAAAGGDGLERREQVMKRMRRANMTALSAAALLILLAVSGAAAVPQLFDGKGATPRPAGTPEGGEREVTPSDEDTLTRCENVLFQPTYVPRGFPYELRVPDQTEAAAGTVGFFDGPDPGMSISVNVGNLRGSTAVGQLIRVLGGPARIRGVEDRVLVHFTYLHCDYSLLGIGIEKSELRTFAEFLVPKGRAFEQRYPTGFALWPEVDPQEAVERCREILLGNDRWRRTPATTARVFVQRELGWEAPTLKPRPGRPNPETKTYHVGPEPAAEVVYVTVAPLVPGACWSVRSVGPATQASPNVFSFALNGRSFSVRAQSNGATQTELTLSFAGYPGRHDVFGVGVIDDGVEVGLGYDPDSVGAYLVIFRDDDGVIGAHGAALPSYNTAAG